MQATSSGDMSAVWRKFRSLQKGQLAATDSVGEGCEGEPSDDDPIMEAKNVRYDDLSCLNCLVIRKDNPYKGAFDVVMMFIACYNIFGNAYFAAFGVPDILAIRALNEVIEAFFLIDMLCCFVQEYQDEETYALVSELKSIAKQYVKTNFFFDFVAWAPVNYFLEEHAKVRLYRLFKLLRLPRLKQLIKVENFK